MKDRNSRPARNDTGESSEFYIYLLYPGLGERSQKANKCQKVQTKKKMSKKSQLFIAKEQGKRKPSKKENV